MDGTFYKTMMGIGPDQAAQFVTERGAHIVALNCGTGMDMVGAAEVAKIYREHCSLPVMVQPNAGLPVLENLKAVYKQLPSDMAKDVPDVLAAGAGIVGSCCGSTMRKSNRVSSLSPGVMSTCQRFPPHARTMMSSSVKPYALKTGPAWLMTGGCGDRIPE